METRRILLDGAPTAVVREGDELVAPDGRRMPLDEPCTCRRSSPRRSSASI